MVISPVPSPFCGLLGRALQEGRGVQVQSPGKLQLLPQGCGSADLRMKIKSFKNIIRTQNISIFSVQETHFSKKGKFSMENFVVFETIRKKQGGGSMLCIHVDLQLVLICEHSNTFELIVTEVKVAGKEIRIITGYGPQEHSEYAEKN